MDSGLILNKDQINILEKNNIDFYYWDITSTNEEIEIEFDDKNEFIKAVKLLNI